MPTLLLITIRLSMKQKRILVVDDDPVVRRKMFLRLKNNGYEVISAVDGAEAVSASRKQKPDLILLDISFPPDVAHGGGVAWDGFRIIEWLRRLDESRNIPVIVISGSDPEKCKARALAKGAIAFFQKPVDDDELLDVIEKTLGVSPPPPDEPEP